MSDDIKKIASRKFSSEEMRKAKIRRQIEAREEEIKLYIELGLTPPRNQKRSFEPDHDK